jgi:hypothetical protein
MLNRWHVFEYLRSFYMKTGRVPNPEEVNVEFHGRVTSEEFIAGISEFDRYLDLKRII